MSEAELKRTVIAFRIFILVPALLIFGSGVHGAWVGHKSSSWPIVIGAIETIEETSGVGRKSSGTALRVRYSYEYLGAFYVGSRIRIGYTDGKDRNFVQRLPRQKLPVRVNPKNPQQAALISGVGSANLVTAGFGLFMAVGVLVATSPRLGRLKSNKQG